MAAPLTSLTCVREGRASAKRQDKIDPAGSQTFDAGKLTESAGA